MKYATAALNKMIFRNEKDLGPVVSRFVLIAKRESAIFISQMDMNLIAFTLSRIAVLQSSLMHKPLIPSLSNIFNASAIHSKIIISYTRCRPDIYQR